MTASCRGCATKWTSTAWAHCGAECHETFLSVEGFDAHRVNGQCWGETTLRPGLVLKHRALEKRNGNWGTPEQHEARKRSASTLRKVHTDRRQTGG